MSRFNVKLGDRVIAKRVSRKTAAAIVESAELADQPGITSHVAPEPRFRVKRHKIDSMSSRPWAVKDAARPAFVGQYATHELAMMAIDNVVRGERGMPARLPITRAEIREAMRA